MDSNAPLPQKPAEDVTLPPMGDLSKNMNSKAKGAPPPRCNPAAGRPWSVVQRGVFGWAYPPLLAQE